jgi:hypothetical protein
MEKTMNEQESLTIITQMINSAKEKLRKETSFAYLYWGYIMAITSLAFFFAIFLGYYKYAPWIWLIPFLAIPFSIWKSFKINQQKKVKTYIGNVIGNVWLAFGISIVLIALCLFRNYNLIVPMSMVLIASAIFITGRAYSFKPLVYGAIICWVAAIITFLFNNNYQYLIYSAALVFGYIIPGHIIRRKSHV